MTLAPQAPEAWDGNIAASAGATTGAGTTRSRHHSAIAARAASSKLAANIVVLDVSKAFGLTDAFVICSGANARQVRTICDEIERQLKLSGAGAPLLTEGLNDARWALLDYGDFVVHVFLEEAREFYDLEHLWGDVPSLSWDDQAGSLVGPRA